MRNKYHSEALKLIKHEAQFANLGSEGLNGVERKLNVRLPSSFKEWYSIEGSVDLLARYSNDDRPLSLESLSRIEILDTGNKVLIFLVESQGVCYWAIELSGLADPPVWVRRNDPSSKWMWCASTFSDFIFTWIWDFYAYKTPLLQAELINHPFQPSELSYLRSKFMEIISTNTWPGWKTYRFSLPDNSGVIRIMSGSQQSDWYFRANTESHFLHLFNLCANVLPDKSQLKTDLNPWNDKTLQALRHLR